MEIINVIAVSMKKERGWIRCAPISGSGVWSDTGMHFSQEEYKSVFSSGPGLYSVEYVNRASLGGTALEVTKAEKVMDFGEIAASYVE